MALMSETMKHPVTSLAGQLLIAMPQMQDRRFTRSVIFLCAHNEEGAMGLVVNKVIDTSPCPSCWKSSAFRR